MPKRQTPLQKLVTFAMSVTEEELIGAMETLKAIKDSRFPKQPRQPQQRRRRRTPTSTQPASNAAVESSSASSVAE